MKTISLLFLFISTTAIAQQQDVLKIEIGKLNRLLQAESKVRTCEDPTSLIDCAPRQEMAMDKDGYWYVKTIPGTSQQAPVDFLTQLATVVTLLNQRIQEVYDWAARQDLALHEDIVRVDNKVNHLPTTTKVERIEITAPTPYIPPVREITAAEQAKIDQAILRTEGKMKD